jgi:hypothetical protein
VERLAALAANPGYYFVDLILNTSQKEAQPSRGLI